MGEDSSRLVTVSCPNHNQVLVRGLWNFFTSRHGVDFFVQWAGKSIPVHRLVLDVFLSPEKLCDDCSIDVPPTQQRHLADVNPDSLLEFIYNGKVIVREDELDHLLSAAKQLDFQMLVDAVESAGAVPASVAAVVPFVEVPSHRGRPNLRLRAAGSVPADDSPLGDGKESESERERRAASQKKRLHVGACSKKVEVRLAMTKKCRPTGRRKIGLAIVGKRDSGMTLRKSRSLNVAKLGGSFEVFKAPAEPSPQHSESSNEDSVPANCSTRGAYNGDGESEWLTSVADSSATTKEQQQLDHSTGDRLYKCPHCDYEMIHQASYIYHLKVIHKMDHDGTELVPGRKQFKCPECDYACSNRSKLKTHSVRHSAEKPFRCDQCFMLFRRKGDLVRHGKEVHLDMKRYMCEECGRKFTNEFALTRHKRVHSGEKPFVCGTCNRSFADRTTFERHVKRHFSNDKPYQCDICGRTFVVRYNLNAHTKRCHKSGLNNV